MEVFVIVIIILFFIYLTIERLLVNKQRRSFYHVVHVNGTRGKSTVARMIHSGLLAGGVKAYCKTTGTVASTIDTHNEERAIFRIGSSSIKEQLKIMKKAYKAGAEVLVIECMAIQRDLQWVSTRQMLMADIGVITNARLDHTDVMGESIQDIRRSLCCSLPQNGVCFTADAELIPVMKEYEKQLDTMSILVDNDDSLPDFDFADNFSLAVAVCQRLRVERETAIKGILNYKKDPYVFSLYELKAGGAIAMALSVNDVDSAKLILTDLQQAKFGGRRLTIIFAGRGDRSFRTSQFIDMIAEIRPERVIVLGIGNRQIVSKMRKRLSDTDADVEGINKASDIDLDQFGKSDAVFATGNLMGEGMILADSIREMGELL